MQSRNKTSFGDNFNIGVENAECEEREANSVEKEWH